MSFHVLTICLQKAFPQQIHLSSLNVETERVKLYQYTVESYSSGRHHGEVKEPEGGGQHRGEVGSLVQPFT